MDRKVPLAQRSSIPVIVEAGTNGKADELRDDADASEDGVGEASLRPERGKEKEEQDGRPERPLVHVPRMPPRDLDPRAAP